MQRNNQALTTYTDNVRLARRVGATWLYNPEQKQQLLKTAYCTYRDTGHKLVLQGDIRLSSTRAKPKLAFCNSRLKRIGSG